MTLPNNRNISLDFEGIVPVNKPRGMTSFQLVRLLRKHLGIRKIGHAGTLDPFAEGVMLMLVGRNFTKISNLLLNDSKEYVGKILLGAATDTYDCDGTLLEQSDVVPTLKEIKEAIAFFQGKVLQVPPMYSAKKINGQKLYELARKGQTVERKPVLVEMSTELLSYDYPYLEINVACSKGTYIRSIAHDLGKMLGCGGHLVSLLRTRSGRFSLEDCFEGTLLQSNDFNFQDLKEKTIVQV